MYSAPLEAMRYVREGLALSGRLNYARGLVRNLNRQGSIYRNVGSYAKAMEAHLEALRVAREHNDLEGMARVNNSIGILYSEQKDSRKAIAYFIKTKNIAQQINHTELLEIALTNIGSDYALLDQLDSAQAYALRAYEMAVRQNDPYSSSILFLNLGNIHYRKKEYPLALTYYRRSLPLSHAVDDQRNLSQTYFEMARLFRETGDLDSCRIYAERSLKLAQAVNNPKNIIDASTLLTEHYEGRDKGRAYDYFKIATAARDQMFDREKIKQIQAMDFNEQLRVQQLESARTEAEGRILTLTLIAGLLALTIIAFLLYRNSRNRQKANVRLEAQKEELQAALSELKTTQTQLIQSEKMASLGELTAGIAHEIQNPLNFVNNYAEVNVELLDEIMEEGAWDESLVKEIVRDVADNERKIMHHGKTAEAIVRGMQQHSRRSSGTRESTDLNALTREYTELAYNGMTAKDKLSKDILTLDLDPRLAKVVIVPGDMGRVILNLLNNAFYAVVEKMNAQPTGYQPAIRVTTRQKHGTLEIRVEDNGTGIAPDDLAKLFQPFFTTKPTGQGTGLGLSLAYDIVTNGHGGRLEVESRLGEGTSFCVTLKV